MSSNSHILVCYNAPTSIYSVYNGKPASSLNQSDDLSESSFVNELEYIKESLQKYFSQVSFLSITKNIASAVSEINRINPDAIFNLVESVEGVSSFEAYFTGLYDLLGYSYTGNNPFCLTNSLDKEYAKQILRAHNVSTPNSLLVKVNEDLNRRKFNLNFPVIAKLIKEDASIGISENSVSNDFKELKKQITFLKGTYNQDIIIEEYVDGREFNVAVLGEQTLPISEISFTGLPPSLPKIVTYEGKWIENSTYYNHTTPICPAKIPAKQRKELCAAALKAFHALECRDYARVDIRLNNSDVPFVIEVNPNPDISQDSGFARAAKANGIEHDELLKTIVNFALQRKIYDSKNRAV